MHNHGGKIEDWKKEFGLSKRQDIIDFSSSINPLGAPKGISELLNGNFHLFSQYPQDYSQSLREKLAEYTGINKNNLLVTNGSIEAIYLVARLVSGKTTLVVEPAFSEYERAVKSNNGRHYSFKTRDTDNFRIDFNKLIKKIPVAGAVFVCNPNNPTGSVLRRGDLLCLLKKCRQRGTILIIDEAFVDFFHAPDKVSILKSCVTNDNIIVIGSLTKFFALAGLRIGYIAGHKKIINRISGFCFPWALNYPAQLAGAYAVSRKAYIKASRCFISKEKDYLFNELSKINELAVYYPAVNFILCRLNSGRLNAAALFRKLAQKGIFIRDCSNFRGLNDKYFRVAVKLRKDNIRLIKELRRVLE